MTQEEAIEILKMGYNVYLTGQAGSGKTFLLNKYIRYLKDNGKGVGVTASTGIAATHMNGITIHSFSGMGIKDEISKDDVRKILKKGYIRKKFANTGVIIIDEVSMLSDRQFDSLNLICQAFKKNEAPFGGMQIVCSGDMFQLPPIERAEKTSGFIYESEIWQTMNIKICYLEEQYRQKEEDELLKLLNHIRSNRIDDARHILESRDFKNISFGVEPTKLYTHNVNVEAINSAELKKIVEKEKTFLMKSSGNEYVVESLKRGCLAPEKLNLKIGAKVMFVKNNFEQGYVNGTMGHIVDFSDENLPVIKILKGRLIKADFTSWKAEEDGQVLAEISQIPLRLAWAITVHKSQGMNLDCAEIDLSKSFAYGMGYVALSRLKSLSGLKLVGINEMALMINQEVFEIDKLLKQRSAKAVKEFLATPKNQVKTRQEEFLNGLQTIYIVRNKTKKKIKNIKI